MKNQGLIFVDEIERNIAGVFVDHWLYDSIGPGIIHAVPSVCEVSC